MPNTKTLSALEPKVTDETAIQRNERGQFLPGQSGNPAGKPVGLRHNTTLTKEFIENKLTHELESEAVEILEVAIQKAKSGDNAMIKFLLGDILAEVRKEAQSQGHGAISINIHNMTDEPKVIFDQESTNE